MQCAVDPSPDGEPVESVHSKIVELRRISSEVDRAVQLTQSLANLFRCPGPPECPRSSIPDEMVYCEHCELTRSDRTDEEDSDAERANDLIEEASRVASGLTFNARLFDPVYTGGHLTLNPVSPPLPAVGGVVDSSYHCAAAKWAHGAISNLECELDRHVEFSGDTPSAYLELQVLNTRREWFENWSSRFGLKSAASEVQEVRARLRHELEAAVRLQNENELRTEHTLIDSDQRTAHSNWNVTKEAVTHDIAVPRRGDAVEDRNVGRKSAPTDTIAYESIVECIGGTIKTVQNAAAEWKKTNSRIGPISNYSEIRPLIVKKWPKHALLFPERYGDFLVILSARRPK